MGASVGSVIVKIFLSATAAILIIFGIALVVVGSMLHSFFYENRDVFVDNKDLNFSIISIVTISIGIGIILFGLCGIVGALMENRCLIVLYGILMFIFFLLMLVIGLIVLMVASAADEGVTEGYKSAFVAAYNDTNSNNQFIDYVQTKFTCCGLDGPEDYKDKNRITGTVPNSCCEKDTSSSGEQSTVLSSVFGNVNTCTVFAAHKRGCLSLVVDYTNGKLKTSLAVSFTMAAIELLASIMACCFACHIGRNQRGQVY